MLKSHLDIREDLLLRFSEIPSITALRLTLLRGLKIIAILESGFGESITSI
jgi:hypothetical protein